MDEIFLDQSEKEEEEPQLDENKLKVIRDVMAELLDLKQTIEDERKLCKIDMQSPVIQHKSLMALVLRYLNQVLGEYEVSTNVEGEHL